MLNSNLEVNCYTINGKQFIQQTDFTYNQLEWLDVVYARLNKNKNEISGSFKREEINKTLKVILRQAQDNKEFTDEDFGETTESMAVQIIADFFLSKAISGLFIKTFLMN